MTELVISFTVDGIHFWPNAPEQYKEFSQPHRHLFKFICWFPQEESNDPARRERELWELRQDAITAIVNTFHTKGDVCDFENMSCEGIADWIKIEFPFSKVFCGEDDNFGAMVS